ncbi:MAG: polyphosphate kinase 2 family protein [Coriobacteriia bacterium]|nr:polyphosphate kinase 2 family protein [Coriobacteriia bacterium]
MNVNDFRYTGKGNFKLSDFPTKAGAKKEDKAKYKALTLENTAKMAELQNRLYAEGKEGLVVIMQAMDAAGKDSTIKHVMSGVNPQGVTVTSFKSPSSLELAHDYLWRAVTALPQRGYIGIFNRSYYEDVLVVRVRNLWKGYKWPERCMDASVDDFFAARYNEISNFEEYLYNNGYRVVKLFLHVSPEVQKERFLARIDEPAKNWKFSSSDVKERALWDQYQDAYEAAIAATSSKHCPWYVIPADQKWMTQYLAGEAILQALEDINPKYPLVTEEQAASLGDAKTLLENEIAPGVAAPTE